MKLHIDCKLHVTALPIVSLPDLSNKAERGLGMKEQCMNMHAHKIDHFHTH